MNKTEEYEAAHRHPTLEPTEARQGKPLGVMRYVLGISLALAVVVLVTIFAIGA